MRKKSSNPVGDVASAREAVRRAEDKAKRDESRLASWDDPDDVRERRRAREAERLEKKMPSDRKCKRCGRLVFERRGWSVALGVCMRCRVVARHVVARVVTLNEEEWAMMFAPIPRYMVDAPVVKARRLGLGLSQATIAERCGWSQEYQLKLEAGRVKTLGQEAVEKLRKALEK